MSSHAHVSRPSLKGTTAVAAACALGVVLLSAAVPFGGYLAVAVLVAVVGLAALAVVAWHVEPAYLLIGAFILSAFNNHWDAFGLPRFVTPDRFLLIAALVGVLLRSPPVRDRPPVPVRGVHALLALLLAWAVGSAIAAGTLTESDGLFGIVDRFAVPFALFLLAPVIFRTPWHRRVLLGALVAFGAYLSLTAVFETLGPRALVYPSFILDPSYGYHGGRARGPFIEANANGVALYACLVAAAIAVATWRRPGGRVAAGVVGLLCAAGLLLTLTRSVWIASLVATLVSLAAFRETRRLVIPAVGGAAVLCFALLALFPQLEELAAERKDAYRSVSERRNVNAAAIAMVRERPLLGFGWSTFRERNDGYFPLLDDVPQTAERRLAVHNVPLTFATELGLIGATLFAVGFLFAVGGAVTTRGPPELLPWRIGLLAIALFWAVVAMFAPLGQVLPTLVPWLWAGVVLGPVLLVARRSATMTLRVRSSS
jgi:putative inorganic carbon (hco3(-)) transporter